MDTLNPTITVLAPTPDSLNNPLNQPIHILLNDGYGSGIALSTLNVIVDGNFAISSGSFQAGYTGTITPLPSNQVDIVVSQVVPYEALASVNVAVAVQAVAGNYASTEVFSFITLDNIAPQIINITPTPGSTQVIASQPITFDIRISPRETAIDIDTLYVSMFGLVQDAYGNVVLDGYGNPAETVFIAPDSLGRISFDQRQVVVLANDDNLGYSVRIQPINPFPLSTLIRIHISVGKVNSGGPPLGTPAFGTARDYAILGASTVTNTGGSVLTGNLGLSPGTSVTGFPPGTFTGLLDVANAAASAAQASAIVTYNDLSTRPVGTTEGVLDGLVLSPGTYTSATTMSLAASGASTLTLNGAGVYIFQIGSTLTTGAGGVATIALTGGARAQDIYWVVGSSATINSGFAGTFQGNVIAQASVTVTLGGVVNGSLVALTGAVTLSAPTTIVVQTTSATPGMVAIADYNLGTIDDQAPYVINQVPALNSIQNSIATPISFSVGDKGISLFGTGVDLSTLEVLVGGKLAIVGGAFQAGYTGVITPNPALNGYNVLILQSELFFPRVTITVQVTVADNSANIARVNYAFFTEDTQPATIVFVYPQPLVTNIPQLPIIIVDFVSEVAISELDLNTTQVTINGIPALIGNVFQPGYRGTLFASSPTTLSVSVEPLTPLVLGSVVTVVVGIVDVFGNAATATNTFTVTTNLTLSSVATPPGAIYDTVGNNVHFFAVGHFLSVVLTANRTGAIVAFTTDGTQPILDGYGAPVGTTQVYSTPIVLLTSQTAMISRFAFDPISGDREESKVEVYFFSGCAEFDDFTGTSLRDGLEYTDKPILIGSQFINNVITTQARVVEGSADYVHDLGRISFIDSLNFTIYGSVSFKVRIGDTRADLASAEWINSINHLADGNNPGAMILQDGYGPTIQVIGSITRVEGRKATRGFFNDEATATLNQRLTEAFSIQGDVFLDVDLDAIVGASAFFRVFDDTYALEVQQYVSKTNSTSLTLGGLSSLIGELPEITIDGYSADGYIPDGYSALTDGYHGYVVLTPPPADLTETRNFTFTQTLTVETQLPLESDITGIFTVKSVSPAVYNTFIYDTGVKYSSAIVGTAFYKRFVTNDGVAFAILVTGKPLDIVLASVVSENLEPGTNIYEFAEKNNVFSEPVFLETGDYNFRFAVTTSVGTRLVGNPFHFKTRQDLSAVLPGDQLVVAGVSYRIESIVLLSTAEFVIEFTGTFPQTTHDILAWSIVRGAAPIVTSSVKIVVDNPLLASLGSDASGITGNLVIQSRQTLTFTYKSANAISVSLLGTFNRFDPQANIMKEGFDPTEINKIFDLDLSTTYQNSTLNTHRVTITPLLPMIIDRVRFYTGVPAAHKQRTRLILDSLPVARSAYKAVRQNGSDAIYVNAVDAYTSLEDGFDEWRYVQIGTNRNRTFRKEIALTTRLDSLAGHPRIHRDLQIFPLPEVPQLVSDFEIIGGQTIVYRSNKTSFAAASNFVTVTYGRQQTLAQIPIALEYLYDDGIVTNFLKAYVRAPGPSSSSVYVDKPRIFKAGEKVAIYDSSGPAITRTTITSIASDASGLLTFADPVPQTGIVVKDYIIAQDANNINVALEVPDFKVVFYGTIYDFGTNVQLTPTGALFQAGPGETILVFENFLGVDGGSLIGGRLTYPLLATPAEILQVDPVNAIINAAVRHFIVVRINQTLFVTQDLLGAIIETFNTTELVTDYVISRTDGTAALVNNSLVSSGLNVRMKYSYVPVSVQFPRQDYCFTVSPTDVVEIRIVPTLQNVTLAELSSFTIDFFNGVAAQAPSSVTFTVNDDGYGNSLFTEAKTLAQAAIIDGYSIGLYDPSFPNTGQQVQFVMPIADIPLEQSTDGYQYSDGYGGIPFTALNIKFTGSSSYCIGEIEALAQNTLINSVCRVTLNGRELFRSPQPVGSLIRVQIEVDRGITLVYFNGQLVVRRPLVFQQAHFQFGATGKILDDALRADFSNVFIQQYFTSSPAKIDRVGRFIEIDGVLIS